MTPEVLGKPSEEELRTSRVHELVRDYPELLAVLSERDVDPGEGGALTMSEVIPGGGLWVGEVMARLAWRDLTGP